MRQLRLTLAFAAVTGAMACRTPAQTRARPERLVIRTTDSVGVITGVVRDSTGPVANVLVRAGAAAVVANPQGRFRLVVPAGRVVLRTRSIGYNERLDNLVMPADHGLDLVIVIRRSVLILDELCACDQPSRPDRLVYAALIDSLFRPRSDTLLVGDSTIHFKAPSGGSPNVEWRMQFEPLSASLVAQLDSVSSLRFPSEALALFRPMKSLTTRERREIFANGALGWGEFHRRYPKQRIWYTLSPIVYSADSLHALVYYEYHCGSVCGGGNLVWLSRRDTTDGEWQITRTINFWTS